jgi:hypothetical protein
MIGPDGRLAARPESTADHKFVPVCQVYTIERHHPSRGAQIIPVGMHRLSLIVGARRCGRYHCASGRARRQKRKTFLALSSMRETTGVHAGGLYRDSSSPLVTAILSDGRATFRPCPRSRTYRIPPAAREPAVRRLLRHGAQAAVGHPAHFEPCHFPTRPSRRSQPTGPGRRRNSSRPQMPDWTTVWASPRGAGHHSGPATCCGASRQPRSTPVSAASSCTRCGTQRRASC